MDSDMQANNRCIQETVNSDGQSANDPQNGQDDSLEALKDKIERR